jgi:hypothetical protein
MRKKILIKAFALLSAAVLTSCDSFLDVELNNQMTQDEVFSKRATTERYLTNVYSYLPQYYDWAYGPIGNYIPMSDEGQFSWTGGLPYNYLMKGSWNLTFTSSYYVIWENMYKGIKQAAIFMAHADECKELTQGEIDILKAEARFLRAYFYQLLVERHGPVYIWGDQDSDQTIHAEDIDRTPLQENIDFIVSEYDKCAAVLPETISDITRYGRVTKGAALAAKARFLLYMASPLYNGCDLYADIVNKDGEKLFPVKDDSKWQKAADAAKVVIDMAEKQGLYSLCENKTETDKLKRGIKSYQMVTLDKWNSETIWGQWYTSGFNVLVRCNPPQLCKTGYGGYGVALRLVDAYPMFETGRYPILDYDGSALNPIIDEKSGYDETGFTENYKHPIDDYMTVTVNNSCVGRDARFYASVLANGFPWYNTAMFKKVVTFYTGGTSSYRGSGDCIKSGFIWRRSTDASLNTDQGNWGSLVFPIFRLAEMYLDYAEACNEKPNRDENSALTYINKVRNRVGLNNLEEAYPEVKGDQALLRKLIQKERMVEMAFETTRFMDIRRWMIATDVINEKVVTLNLAATDFKSSWQRVTTLWSGGGRIFSDKNYLFPIPQAQLNEMQNMTQNYGW